MNVTEEIRGVENALDLQEVAIGESKPKRRVQPWWVLAGAAGLAVAGVAGWRMLSPAAAATYQTVAVERATLAKTISATGKLQAVTTVQVGTQVSGTVAELYADFNDRVKAGQVVARLDPSQLEAQLSQVRANRMSAEARVAASQTAVLSAEASVQAAQANAERAQSVLLDAERQLALAQNLLKEGATPRREVERSEAAVTQAAAQVQQARAQVNQAVAQAQSSRSQGDQAKAELAQSEASVQLATVNLERAVIKAPIDGVVVSRNVDVGQTVAASLQAPTLFLIANDLTKMQVLADIDEADVGQLGPQSKVTFTVDAFPRDTFRGRISQIRLAPVITQNVVTYTAVIDVDNPEMKLRPGMTANVTAVVEERADVPVVPNAALRFRPENAPVPEGRQRPTVWKIGEQGVLTAVPVRPGMTDGIRTEIVSGELNEGDRIATPAGTAAAQQQQTGTARSPFSGAGGSRGGRR
jgi:HlyD family secretion protein